MELLASSSTVSMAVGFAAIALQVGALGAREHVPVHVAQIVARRVGAVFGELLAETEIRRAVQAGDEAVHHGLRHQVQAGDAGEHRGIRKRLHASGSAHFRAAAAYAFAADQRAKSRPNRCGPIPRGNSAECGGAAPESPAP